LIAFDKIVDRRILIIIREIIIFTRRMTAFTSLLLVLVWMVPLSSAKGMTRTKPKRPNQRYDGTGRGQANMGLGDEMFQKMIWGLTETRNPEFYEILHNVHSNSYYNKDALRKDHPALARYLEKEVLNKRKPLQIKLLYGVGTGKILARRGSPSGFKLMGRARRRYRGMWLRILEQQTGERIDLNNNPRNYKYGSQMNPDLLTCSYDEALRRCVFRTSLEANEEEFEATEPSELMKQMHLNPNICRMNLNLNVPFLRRGFKKKTIKEKYKNCVVAYESLVRLTKEGAMNNYDDQCHPDSIFCENALIKVYPTGFDITELDVRAKPKPKKPKGYCYTIGTTSLAIPTPSGAVDQSWVKGKNIFRKGCRVLGALG